MVVQVPYPNWQPSKGASSSAFDANYTADFSVDSTYIFPLTGMLQGVPIRPVSFYIDNTANSNPLVWQAGAATGLVPAYGYGGLNVEGVDTLSLVCTTSQRVVTALKNYPIDYGFKTLTAPATAASNDPYFSSVIGLYHFDGVNLATVALDNSNNGFGDLISLGVVEAHIDTSKAKFGGGSWIIEGLGNTEACHSSTPALFKNNWTVEFFFQQQGNPSITGTNNFLYGRTVAANTPVIQLEAFSTGEVGFGINAGIAPSKQINDNNWHHVALVGMQNFGTVFIDGVLTVQGNIANAYASDQININMHTNISAYWLDELRITNVARYLTNFTPPTQPFFNQ